MRTRNEKVSDWPCLMKKSLIRTHKGYNMINRFNGLLVIVKELEAKNHFLYIDKCHNSVINYRNLPINNPKRDIVGANAYAKFE